MKEYIEREALYNKLEGRYKFSNGAAHKAYGLAIDDVCDAPAADVVERKRGEWIEEPCNHKPCRLKSPEKWVINKCSACGYSNGRKKSNFCPNCGADMREVEHETA